MREIKFNFIFEIDGTNHHRYYSLDDLESNSIREISDVPDRSWLKVKRQFTGFHDPEGAEIYERDIVYIAKAKEHREIRFSDGGFRIFASDGDSWPMNQERAIGMLVVGNAFEHPHLMEEGNGN